MARRPSANRMKAGAERLLNANSSGMFAEDQMVQPTDALEEPLRGLRSLLPSASPHRCSMFRVHSLTIGMVVVICLSLFVALAVLLTPSYGYWGYGDCCGCQSTWCAWSETWHAPSALDTPLRPYFVPRMPGRCGVNCFEQHADDGGCANPAAECAAGAGCGCNYPPQAAVGFDPVQFERLGQVPNDLGLGSLPAESPQGR